MLEKKKNKKVIERIINNVPIYVNYDLNEEIKYYQNRLNDKNLTPEQYFYASKKVEMLTTGVGRIYITNDKKLNNVKNKSTNFDKNNRRVVNIVNGKKVKLVSGIYSKKENENHLDFLLQLDFKETSILNIDSNSNKRLSVVSNNKLIETTSTISPFQIDELNKFWFSSGRKDKTSKSNRNLRNKYTK